jgi:type VI secretion system protein ImpK
MTAPRLCDSFVGVQAYLSCLLNSVETRQPPYVEVKEQIHRLLSESEEKLARGLAGSDDYDQARFAICSWVDEAILSSTWQHKNLWLDDQLQRFHYNTADAGEQFFVHLDDLGVQQREVREVYYLCLALGFTGRYCHPGDERHLERIKTAQLELLLDCPQGVPTLERAELFPEALPGRTPEPGTTPPKAASRLAKAICLAAPVLLFGILYLIYYFTLSGISENFLRTVAD